ncbi:hypothetical protein NB496_09235 [Vibrio alginolyticus]|uniref:hypothetical protein n=1 Tax=Vibrio harveyi group TaxID=717610 RepID=UPI00215C8292|nr:MULTISPECIES: hypothetical protein [Vibrio harveyi group]MCR9640813.1 hypothetical protein [Vibrio alginolyticus]MCS0356349.1 hypothetical protein [Vibrio diabolicus]
MKNVFAVTALAALTLVGCGGGDGDSSSSGTNTPDVSQFSHNGIYANTQDLVLMLVDSNRETNALIVGDFSQNAIIAAHDASVKGDTMTLKGLTYVDTSMFQSDSTLSATASFDESGVTLTGKVDNDFYSYSLAKAPDTKPLSEFTGTYTNPNDGSVWTVSESGELTINGDCQISGQLQRNGAYFNLNYGMVSNCSDPGLNGPGSGVVLTATYQGKDYLAGVFSGVDERVLWGSVPLQ